MSMPPPPTPSTKKKQKKNMYTSSTTRRNNDMPARAHANQHSPNRPIKFSEDGARPSPARQFFRRWTAARHGPPHFRRWAAAMPGPLTHRISIFPGPARPMTFAARPMKIGPYLGPPTISVGRPVEIKGRPVELNAP